MGTLAEREAVRELTPEQRERFWERLQAHAFDQGHFEGAPRPVTGIRLRIADGHPLKEKLEAIQTGEAGAFVCTTEDVDETITVRNRWWSHRLGTWVTTFTENGRPGFSVDPMETRGRAYKKAKMLLDTIGAAQQHDVRAELTAVARLGTLLKKGPFESYLTTGSFMERSTRSQAVYLFRRLRPTIVYQPGDDPGVPAAERNLIPTVALCLHPLGYYEDTFAGAMVPTDDVIAHLMLMRGDEHFFWRKANHHTLTDIRSGL